jgi:hypothetical protein
LSLTICQMQSLPCLASFTMIGPYDFLKNCHIISLCRDIFQLFSWYTQVCWVVSNDKWTSLILALTTKWLFRAHSLIFRNKKVWKLQMKLKHFFSNWTFDHVKWHKSNKNIENHSNARTRQTNNNSYDPL